MTFTGSRRLQQLGSAIFSEVAEWKREVMNQGVDVIDLGIGSPDLPPSSRILAAITEAVQNPANYGYPTSEGSLAFREAVAKWYQYRFGVELNPETEILTLMGSQDGLAHLALSLCDPGDVAIVPDPGYPIYSASLVLAGVEPYLLPLRAENQFLPRLQDIPDDVAAKAKFILLNYPSNPLSAVADRAFFEHLIAYAKKHELLIVHDLAYSEMAFDGYKPMSILEIEGAKEVAVEFHSLSKSFNMAGCRIAFLTGHADAVKALKTLKSNIDYGVFGAVQAAGIAALEEDMENDHSVSGIYEERRNAFISALHEAGWVITPPKATMFIWAPIPAGWTSRQISREMLFQTGVVVIPGDAFGAEGEGFVRIALVQEKARLVEAARRIGEWLHSLE
ncbi:aminotransferase class I/II-fold pyridoxal phosphate-dependent enzyme [Paenibacillus roseipurpureus]|uniref:Aminotransferase n=1 Tax=Paenibacillus roseopurpureus TaxID=2918901 RepID=A0AA96LPH0_9BACL|nr:aminotransferase class I/II-fold pyridoxal phosphate-dependent enzyme [Paenibacillus sp. MBLB1832]WNR43584.1 aminotransferase class I/II-fold pyridoxal phosphate-dependent enzyme [Paenibacillus sp. MBLB1832]